MSVRRVRSLGFPAVLAVIMLAMGLGGWSGGDRAPFHVVSAAPTHSIKEFYVPISVLPTVVNIPASAVILGCSDLGGPSIGYNGGCMLVVDINDGDPPIARYFRGASAKSLTAIPPSQFDGGVEHSLPGTVWFQRSGGGFTTRYVVLETN